MPLPLRDRALPWIVFALCLIPIGHLIFRTLANDLGVNPIETLIRGLGEWGLRFVIGGLAITPIARLARQPRLIRLRRPIGLAAFLYVTLHLTMYIAVDQYFDWAAIWKDIVKRPYITFGMLGFVLLIPLAATSFNAAIRKVGPRTWRTLHRAIYAVGVLGVVHYYLLVKADHTEPLIYGAILAALLAYRVVGWARSRKRAAA